MTKTNNRRTFFRTGLRYTALGLLGALGVKLSAGKERTPLESPCTGGGLCSRCTEFTGCGRPAALSRKQFLKKENHDG